MIQGAWGWCTGMTQRDGMGREVEEGFRMGSTCVPVADSWQCMAKPIQYGKVKKKDFGIVSKEINVFLEKNWTWNNRLVPNRKRSMLRLYIVTLLI